MSLIISLHPIQKTLRVSAPDEGETKVGMWDGRGFTVPVNRASEADRLARFTQEVAVEKMTMESDIKGFVAMKMLLHRVRRQAKFDRANCRTVIAVINSLYSAEELFATRTTLCPNYFECNRECSERLLHRYPSRSALLRPSSLGKFTLAVTYKSGSNYHHKQIKLIDRRFYEVTKNAEGEFETIGRGRSDLERCLEKLEHRHDISFDKGPGGHFTQRVGSHVFWSAPCDLDTQLRVVQAAEVWHSDLTTVSAISTIRALPIGTILIHPAESEDRRGMVITAKSPNTGYIHQTAINISANGVVTDSKQRTEPNLARYIYLYYELRGYRAV